MLRRNFLLGSTLSVGASAFSARSYAQILGANERVRLALIGCGGRGQDVAQLMSAVPNTEYAAFVDLYDVNAKRAKQSRWGRNAGEVYQDFRHVLDRKDIHALHVATPAHWHAIPAYMASLAGKDAYVEKPLTHNIREGRALVDSHGPTRRSFKRERRIAPPRITRKPRPSFAKVHWATSTFGGRTPNAKYYRMNGDEDRPHGVAIYGTKGVIIADRIGYDLYPETNTAAARSADRAAEREAYKASGIGKLVEGATERRFVQGADRTDLHVANFIECVRTRAVPSADVEIGHRSCLVPHLINIAYRTNEKIHWDPKRRPQ